MKRRLTDRQRAARFISIQVIGMVLVVAGIVIGSLVLMSLGIVLAAIGLFGALWTAFS